MKAGIWAVLIGLMAGLSGVAAAANRPGDKSKRTQINMLRDSLQSPGLALQKKIRFMTRLSRRYRRVSPDSAILYGRQALDMAFKDDDSVNIVRNYQNIGVAYQIRGLYAQSLEQHQKALNIAKKMQDQKLLALCYNDIGNVYYLSGSGGQEKALKYYHKAMKISRQIGDSTRLSDLYNNTGFIMMANGRTEEALDRFKKALALRHAFEDLQGITLSYKAIALTHIERGQLDTAGRFLDKALFYSRQAGDPSLTASLLNTQAEVRLRQQLPEEALPLLKKADSIAARTDHPNVRRVSLEKMHRAYNDMGRYRDAYHAYGEYAELRESLHNDKKSKEMGRMEAQFAYEQEKQKLEQEKAIQQTRLEAQEQLTRLSAVAAAILLAFAIFMVILYQQRQNAYRLVMEKNDRIQRQSEELQTLNETISQQNDNLEKKVASRTRELADRNAKLEEYAFMNSHRLRAPLSRILALVEVLEIDDDAVSPEENEEAYFLAQIKHSTEELDDVIREIGVQLRN